MQLKIINMVVQSGGSVLSYLTSTSNNEKEITHSNLFVRIPFVEAFKSYMKGWLVCSSCLGFNTAYASVL